MHLCLVILLFCVATLTTTTTAILTCNETCTTEIGGTDYVRQFCQNAKLTEIPHECIHPEVTVLSLEGNEMTSLVGTPFARYPKLVEIELDSNRISNWEHTVFQNLSLNVLKLKNNTIDSIEKKHFIGLHKLAILDLAENNIKEIRDYTFVELCGLTRLHLSKNKNLKTIYERAFAGLVRLEQLDLSETGIPSFPHEDIKGVFNVSVAGAKKLKTFPTHENLPKIRYLHLNYPAHCCMYINESWYQPSASVPPSGGTSAPNTTKGTARIFTGNPFGRRRRSDRGFTSQQSSIAREMCSSPRPTIDNLDFPVPISCTPKPDEFNSCTDVMGWWPLRVFIWIILLINFAGNLTVIAVTLIAYHRFTAARLLIINMAFADLCMGVYLLTISIVDAQTFDEYANHAIAWKTGGGCAFAGFLSVFSSELSLFMLTSITVERLYRLQNALYFKKMRMKQAILIVTIGWIFAVVMATLPLVGINDYTVSAICLPFDVSGGGKAYITILLCLNAAAFFIILTVYTYLFFSITGGKWNRKNQDVTVFRKMSLLVAVDFFCWCPIIVLGLLAAFRGLTISLGAAKVIMVFIYPLNACANPFLYVIFTIQFRRDFFEFWYKKFGMCQWQYRKALDTMGPASPRNFPGGANRRGTECSNLPRSVDRGRSMSTDTGNGTLGVNSRRNDEGRKISAGSNTEVTTISNGHVVGDNSVAMEATNHLGTLAEEESREVNASLDVSWLSESATV